MTRLLIRGQRVLLDGQLRPAALHIVDGKIADITDFSQIDRADRIVDAGDLLVTPGIVDSHVHINEPGRTEWEGFETATQAAAAGGITTVVDMPLNCIPATIDRAAAETKYNALRDQLHVNVAFWGGVVPGNTAALQGLADFGVPGCKCFLCPSGVDEFGHVTRGDLELAMPRLRDLGQTLLVHAEIPQPLELAEAELAKSNADPRLYDTYLRSRPNLAEDLAVALVIEMSRKHNAPAHIVHLSSASALPLLAAAQADGVPITAETCLHYLSLNAEAIADGATQYKCAPPIRSLHNQQQLWQGLQSGVLQMVVSDHSPCTPQLKRQETGDFLGAWGGIASLQLGLSLMWTQCQSRGFDVAQMLRWNAEAPAKLIGLQHKKAKLAIGFDADVVLWDDKAQFRVDAQKLHHKNKITPYAGQTLRGVVENTFIGGQLAYSRQHGLAAKSVGRFVAVNR